MAKTELKPREKVSIDVMPIDDVIIMSPSELMQRHLHIKYVQKETMKEKIHYGTLPGTSKPTLYKPGAETLCSVFNLGVGEPDIQDLSTDDEIRYRVVCKLFSRSSGKMVGTGIGECSSREEKYQWRRLVCKEEWDDTLPDRRKEKWEAKKGKDGWKIKDKDGEYVGQKIKMVRTNPADLANTILKMAKKRSFVDATLTVTGASDLFEQDLEDMEDNTRSSILAEYTILERGKPVVTQPEQKTSMPSTPQTNAGSAQTTESKTPPEPVANDVRFANKSQLDMIKKLCQEKGLTSLAAVEHFGVISVEELPAGMVNDVLTYIRDYQKPSAKGK